MRPALATFFITLLANAPLRAGELCLASTVKDKQIAAAVARDLKLRYEAAQPALGASAPTLLRVNNRPGCAGNVTLDVYEFKEHAQFVAIEALARQAQASVPLAGSLHLRFYEREVWVSSEGGGGYRGKERLLKATTLPARQASKKAGQ
jgi:hypothetical protein